MLFEWAFLSKDAIKIEMPIEMLIKISSIRYHPFAALPPLRNISRKLIKKCEENSILYFKIKSR